MSTLTHIFRDAYRRRIKNERKAKKTDNEVLLPVDNVVQLTKLQLSKLLEGGLREIEPVAESAGSAFVNHLNLDVLVVAPEVYFVTALERRVLRDSGNKVAIGRGGKTTGRGLEHRARVVRNAAVVTALLNSRSSNDCAGNGRNKDSNESGAHLQGLMGLLKEFCEE